LAEALADTVIATQQARRAGSASGASLDLDRRRSHPRPAAVRLVQWYYDTLCYLPLLATLTFTPSRNQ